MEEKRALFLRVAERINQLAVGFLVKIVTGFRHIITANDTNAFIVFGFLLIYFILGDIYLYVKVQQSDGILPLNFDRNGSVPCHSSPWCYVDMKSLLLDLPDFYIHVPFSAILNHSLKLRELVMITPNMISVFHALLALVSFKCIISDSLPIRRIGVLVFELRNFLDAVDGTIARSRAQIQKPTKENALLGYYMDGFCDGFGCFFLFLGCFIYLRRHPIRPTRGYSPIPVFVSLTPERVPPMKQEIKNDEPESHLRIFDFSNPEQQTGKLAAIFGFQSLLTSFFWNLYIERSKSYLQNPQLSLVKRAMAGEIVKSTFFWIFVMIWRIFNPHSTVEMLLVAIFLDRMTEFLMFMKYIGFLIICILAFYSELYMSEVQQYLNI